MLVADAVDAYAADDFIELIIAAMTLRADAMLIAYLIAGAQMLRDAMPFCLDALFRTTHTDAAAYFLYCHYVFVLITLF